MEAMEAGRRIEVEKSTADGRTWLVQAAPLRDRNGAIMGGVEVSLDITRYRHADEALAESPQKDRRLEAPAKVDDPPSAAT
jgi:DNA-binding IclR family transcriptional regulator